METPSDNREEHVRRIVEEPLRIIEEEHGLTGLDHVLAILQERRKSAIFALEQEREGSST